MSVWIDAALLGVGVLSAVGGLLMLAQTNRELRRTINACQCIDQGDFEARIVGITEGGDLGRLQHVINSMIDRCDAYIRESMACQE